MLKRLIVVAAGLALAAPAFADCRHRDHRPHYRQHHHHHRPAFVVPAPRVVYVPAPVYHYAPLPHAHYAPPQRIYYKTSPGDHRPHPPARGVSVRLHLSR